MSITSNRGSSWRQALAVAMVMAGLSVACIAHARPDSGALRTQMAESAGARAAAIRVADDDAERPAPNVAPAEAARRAAQEYGGRVLNVVLEDGPGGPYYRVKLLDGGRVRVVHVEARR